MNPGTCASHENFVRITQEIRPFWANIFPFLWIGSCKLVHPINQSNKLLFQAARPINIHCTCTQQKRYAHTQTTNSYKTTNYVTDQPEIGQDNAYIQNVITSCYAQTPLVRYCYGLVIQQSTTNVTGGVRFEHYRRQHSK